MAQALPPVVEAWVVDSVARILDAWIASGGSGASAADDRDAVLAEARLAGSHAAAELAVELAALAAADVDHQRVTPLQLVRGVVALPTAVLAGAGVPPVVRDHFVEERFPADLYGLNPASLAALDPAIGELALAWGAAKAIAHRQRHSGGA